MPPDAERCQQISYDRRAKAAFRDHRSFHDKGMAGLSSGLWIEFSIER